MTGSEIKELRLANGLRQKDCAYIIGVGIRQWQKYEQGYPCKEIYLQILKYVIKSNMLNGQNFDAAEAFKFMNEFKSDKNYHVVAESRN